MLTRFLFASLLPFMSLPSSGLAASESAPTLQIVRSLENGKPVKIVCFGDSITGQYYHTGGRRAWTQALGQTLVELYPRAQLEMINAGISGNTSAHGLERMDADVFTHKPDLIVAMFGMNDAAHLTTDDLRRNLQQMVERAHENNAEIVLMTPNAIAENDPSRTVAGLAEYAEVVRAVARVNNLTLADTYLVYEDIRQNDPTEWMRLMSDAIHPNMRGHRLFASIVGEAISGRKIAPPEFPILRPQLPRLKELLETGQLVRITAMKPTDGLIKTAIRSLYPEAQLEIKTWDPTGKSITELEEEAKQNGWFHYNENPDLPKPDLTIVAVPSAAFLNLDRRTYLSYGWVINWSQSWGNNPRADCLPMLPSVWEPSFSESDHPAEQFAIACIEDKDLPYIRRNSGDLTPASELISQSLAEMLRGESPQSQQAIMERSNTPGGSRKH